MDEQEVRQIIREEIANASRELLLELVQPERYTFQKHIQMFDSRNIQTGRTDGTIIATASDQKIGFYGTTPVDQPATVADPSISTVSGSGADATINTNFTNLDNAVESIIDRLQELGLIK